MCHTLEWLEIRKIIYMLTIFLWLIHCSVVEKYLFFKP